MMHHHPHLAFKCEVGDYLLLGDEVLGDERDDTTTKREDERYDEENDTTIAITQATG